MNTRNKFHLLKINALTLLLGLLSTGNAVAQDYLFDIETINVEDGLPHRMTYNIVQDKEGFIWVNTQGAISRYDGYSFKTYNASFLDIWETKNAHMAIDVNNHLWYCANNRNNSKSGIINTRTDSIYSVETTSEGRFTSKNIIYVENSAINNNDIFIATRAGVMYKYNGGFEEIYRFPTPFLVAPICKVNPDGSYWVTYNKSIIKIKDGKLLKTINTGMYTQYIISTYPELVVKMHHPFDPVKYRKLENDTFVPYSIASHAPEDIKGVLQLHQDYTCYATKDALLIRDKKGKLIYSFDEFDPAGHSIKLLVNRMLSDRQHILWATTENGLIKLTAKKNPFKTLLPGRGIRGIFKEDKTLWAGGGLYMDTVPEGVKAEQVYLDTNRNDAFSFYKDLRGHLWIGTLGEKIVEYIPDQDKYIDYNFNRKQSFELPFQNAATQNYWIGTSSGLLRFDKKLKKITPFTLPVASTAVEIRQAYQNPQGIWLASNKGIFLMDAEKEVILKHYTTAYGLPSNSITHIHEDNKGIFWLGTKDAGLVRWDLKANSFHQYTSDEELSNNKIYAVYEDDYQTLWLPSDYGLMAFDKNTATTRVYLPRDGIAHEEFNHLSHFQDKDGTLYFGGLNGITKFHPAALQQETAVSPPLHATRVRILEKDTEAFTDKTPGYLKAKKISLGSGDRILELELTLLDYERSTENQYAYKLAGKQEQWIYTGENKLSIINPPYGRYNLVIKARGASGQWSENILTIPLYVQAPFYMQWWFILTLIVTVAAGILAVIRWRVQKLEKDRTRLENEVQKRTHKIEEQAQALKVLDKAKTRFFANITHEFRTPLTLVTGPIEQMIVKPPPPAALKGKLSEILKNTRNLLGLINQLLDLSKLEGGRMKVEVSHGDIVGYTEELVYRFQPLADKKNLHLDFKARAGEWKTHFDGDKWTKILYNLLSNAIKFTPEGGRIRVDLKQVQQTDQDCIQLVVKDTGIGLDADKLSHIFDRFYQADASSTRMQGGTGIGLSLVKELTELQNGTITVQSIPGEGAAFTVLLPVAPANEDAVSLLSPEDIVPSLMAEASWIQNEQALVNGDVQKQVKEKLELLIIEDNTEMRAYIRSCIDASVL